MQKLVEQYFVELIKAEMELADANVWVLNQNRAIPNDAGLYIVIGESFAVPISAKTEPYYVEVGVAPDPIITQMWERQEVQAQSNVQIDFYSRDNTALSRRMEILMALNSQASKQMQEAYNFKIARIPVAFNNTSTPDGGSNLNRFTAVIPTLVWYRKTKMVQSGGDYYDDFKQRVDDEATIGTPTGLIEFEIDSTGVK